MLLRQLKYFVAVVETNSFTEAAEECFISQSAISQQIKALERELGVELLHRGNRKFTLTPAGLRDTPCILVASQEQRENENPYIPVFAEILQRQFDAGKQD